MASVGKRWHEKATRIFKGDGGTSVLWSVGPFAHIGQQVVLTLGSREESRT